MKLGALASELTRARLVGDSEIDVTSVHYDSRETDDGGLFAAIPGSQRDGHDFIAQAVANGAAAVLVSDLKAVPSGVSALLVADPRLALAEVATLLAGRPTAEMRVVAVTGTNGKTTCSFLVDSILREAGRKTGVIGTIEYRIGDDVIPSTLTTPEAPDLQRMFRQMRAAGVSDVVMEVSSHALALHRVEGVDFACGIFTNLTQDHLDFHADLEEYGAVKSLLFTHHLPRTNAPAVINVGDNLGRTLASTIPGRCLTYSLDPEFEPAIVPRKLELGTDGIRLDLHTPAGNLELRSSMVGAFNALNIMASVGAAIALEIELEAIVRGVAALPLVRGRLETVPNELGYTVAIDYAHTPDALQRVLQTLRELCNGRLICVFGCGGDRDRKKRPIMGRVAAELANIAIVTSDNPRTENPQRIIEDILVGVASTGASRRSVTGARETDGYVVEPDRRNAIWMAIGLARENDIVVIAGKGHEDYQILGKEYFHFDDREEASTALSEKKRALDEYGPVVDVYEG
ncbi:MAG: UDP-N-acetylmuramoyl-L-alanyl-D-glutamate--2,6-diaminopimelate ligase [Myxococcales bacterium]|nr:UDP-N-acetylmuramoyl-L-alanyl-D-glutamate--2,6-diaminopimelate ligase [Myxococcales bacterium]